MMRMTAGVLFTACLSIKAAACTLDDFEVADSLPPDFDASAYASDWCSALRSCVGKYNACEADFLSEFSVPSEAEQEPIPPEQRFAQSQASIVLTCCGSPTGPEPEFQPGPVEFTTVLSVGISDEVAERGMHMNSDISGDIETVHVHLDNSSERFLVPLEIVFQAHPERPFLDRDGSTGNFANTLLVGGTFNNTRLQGFPTEEIRPGFQQARFSEPKQTLIIDNVLTSFADWQLGDRVVFNFYGRADLPEHWDLNQFGVLSALGPSHGDVLNGYLSSIGVVSWHPRQSFRQAPAQRDQTGVAVNSEQVYRVVPADVPGVIATFHGPLATALSRVNVVRDTGFEDRELLLAETRAGDAGVLFGVGDYLGSVAFPGRSMGAGVMRRGPFEYFFSRPRDLTDARIQADLSFLSDTPPGIAQLRLVDQNGRSAVTPRSAVNAAGFRYRASDFEPVAGQAFDVRNVVELRVDLFAPDGPAPAISTTIDNPSIELRNPKVRLSAYPNLPFDKPTREFANHPRSGEYALVARPGDELVLRWESADSAACEATQGDWLGAKPTVGFATQVFGTEQFGITCSGDNRETHPSTHATSLRYPAYSLTFVDGVDDRPSPSNARDLRFEFTADGYYRATFRAYPGQPFPPGPLSANVHLVNADVTAENAELVVWNSALILTEPSASFSFQGRSNVLPSWETGHRVTADPIAFLPDADAYATTRIWLPGTEADVLAESVVARVAALAPSADVDGDGIVNETDADNDNDGIADHDETVAGLNPFRRSDALADHDGDGDSNLAESLLGTLTSQGTNPVLHYGDVFASILPTSRSVQIDQPATVFATVASASTTHLTDCRIAPSHSLPASFRYFETDPATNLITGTANPGVSLAPGSSRSFLLEFVPDGLFESHPLEFQFLCLGANKERQAVAVLRGVNTLALSSSRQPVPDVVVLPITPSADGILNIPHPSSTSAFAVATVNVGAPGRLTVSAASQVQGLSLTVCRTSTDGACATGAPGPEAGLELARNETGSFAVFANARQTIAFLPGVNRIEIELRTEDGLLRGSSSVAVRTANP